jgi:hypothetical protein
MQERLPVEPITGDVTTTVYLGSAAYPSPLVIAAGGKVAPSGYTAAKGVYSSTAGVALAINSGGSVYGGMGAAGGVGGIGVDLTASATIKNSGKIEGGVGYNQVSTDNGTGGTAVQMDGGSLTNYDLIKGGVGYGTGNGGGGVIGGSATLAFTNNSGASIIGGAAPGAGVGGTALNLNGGTGTNYGLIEAGNSNSGAGGTGAMLGNGENFTNDFDIDGGTSTSGAGGVGVNMLLGGTLTNAYNITGGGGGGTSAGGAGVTFGLSTSTLTNNEGGTITGGGASGGAAGTGVIEMLGATFKNYATVTGGANTTAQGGTGVSMSNGGTLDSHSGVISGGSSTSGVGGTGVVAVGTSTNVAMINTTSWASYNIEGGGSTKGDGGVAVDLGADSSLNNQGAIRGGFTEGANSTAGTGVYVGAGSPIMNSGFIEGGINFSKTGTGGTGVDLAASQALMLNSGTISGGTNAYEGHFFGTAGVGVEVMSGATLLNLGIVEGGGFPNGGTGNVGLYLDGGSADNLDRIKGSYYYGPDGKVYSDSVKFGTVTGSTLQFQSHSGVYGTLTGAIEGFRVNDTIQVLGTVTKANASGDPDSGTYVIQTPDDGKLYFSGNYTGEHFAFSTSTTGGATVTDITLSNTPCFRTGTRIRTPAGERAVETLRIGDVVTTLSGAGKPVRWIGRRHYSHSAVQNPYVLPVRIATGALAPGMPRRDLWVSPEHAMWIDGALVPAHELVNGASIIRDVAVGELTYIHLEFDAQEIVFAEGAPSESFVDDDSRQMFDNAEEFGRLYPDAPRTAAQFCAPRLEEGDALEAIRRRLCARAGLPDLCAAPDTHNGVGALL